MTGVLIIGYGNTLRGDDGAGYRVAEILAARDLPGVRSLPVHQLTPELAEPLATVQLALFIDAYAATPDQGLQLQTLVDAGPRAAPRPILGHAADPRSLLALTQQLYGVLLVSYWILIPGIQFTLGEQFSSTTEQGIQEALQQIDQLLKIGLGSPLRGLPNPILNLSREL